jgi:hypothetical protein
VAALEKFVSYYKEDMEPYALRLTTQLLESFERSSYIDPLEDGGASILAAQ